MSKHQDKKNKIIIEIHKNPANVQNKNKISNPQIQIEKKKIEDLKGIESNRNLCQVCFQNFIKCELCQGYFEIMYFQINHQDNCQILKIPEKDSIEKIECNTKNENI